MLEQNLQVNKPKSYDTKTMPGPYHPHIKFKGNRLITREGFLRKT